jgi:hypothetical protein
MYALMGIGGAVPILVLLAVIIKSAMGPAEPPPGPVAQREPSTWQEQPASPPGSPAPSPTDSGGTAPAPGPGEFGTGESTGGTTPPDFPSTQPDWNQPDWNQPDWNQETGWDEDEFAFEGERPDPLSALLKGGICGIICLLMMVAFLNLFFTLAYVGGAKICQEEPYEFGKAYGICFALLFVAMLLNAVAVTISGSELAGLMLLPVHVAMAGVVHGAVMQIGIPKGLLIAVLQYVFFVVVFVVFVIIVGIIIAAGIIGLSSGAGP